MDIQSYLDYYCVNIFLANTDFGYEEAAAWKLPLKQVMVIMTAGGDGL